MALSVRNGYLPVGAFRGIPIKIHWLFPMGGLYFSHFRVDPLGWAAFAFVVLVHEFGHAAVVRWCGYEVIAVHLTAIGGEFRWNGAGSPLKRGYIAWGGVLAEALLYGVAASVAQARHPAPFVSFRGACVT
jgi:hypothetical protein